MIKEKIEISVYNSYNLIDWEKEIIKKCIFDNPSFTQVELAELIGISSRDLIRKFKRYEIDYQAIRRSAGIYELKFKNNVA